MAIYAIGQAGEERRRQAFHPLYLVLATGVSASFVTADLFNLEVDLIFYDTTTASFHVDQEDDDGAGLRKFGHSKEGFWAPQVVVALAVTRECVPVRSWVLPGNTADVSTVERVRADLRGWNLGRAMFVADSGMNSEDNRSELAKACGKYLLACRMASVAEIKRDVLSKRGRYTVFTDNLQAKEVIVGDGERRKRYILCYNPKEADRQKNHRRQLVELLEAELESHPDKSATAQWAIELLASRRFAHLHPVHTTNFIPVIDEETCNGCGKCVNVCPVEAMTLVSAHDPEKPRMKIAKLNDELCLGCGVCIRSCNKHDSLSLASRPKRVLTPLNGTHRAVVMAIERGKLQNLVFDNQVLWSHRAMAAVLGVILKLPPIKQVLASEQLKSRYLESLISHTKH